MHFIRLSAAFVFSAVWFLSLSTQAKDSANVSAAEAEKGRLPDERPPHLVRLQPLVKLQEKLKERAAAFEQRRQRLRQVLEEMQQELLEHRQQGVDAIFNPLLGDMTRGEQHVRIKALKELEALRSYPPHPQITPGVLLRLGQLYFEQDESEHLANMERFAKQLENIPKGQQADDLLMPEQDFGRSISVLEQLLEQYPSYKYTDAALYLLGICYYLQGYFEDAVDEWRKLVRKYPKSVFRDETLFRLGDYDFDDDFWPEAAQSYGQISDPQSPFYERALYKLAWSHYLNGKYLSAVEAFMRLLDSLWEEESRRESPLAKEAIRYIVNSFVEQQASELTKAGSRVVRDKKGFPKGSQVVVVDRMKKYFGSRPRPYTRVIFMHLGDTMAKGAESQAALSTFRTLLKQDPMHESVPDLYARLLQVLDEGDTPEEAMQLRQQLVQQFGPNGTWMLRHAAHEDLIEKTRLWVRDVMLAVAVYEHEQGNQYRDQSKTAIAHTHYEQAARLYIRYLNLYPEWSDVDQAIFYLAEVTLEMGLFGNSINLYKQLQNWLWKTKYKKQAYVNVVFAYQQAIEFQEKRGKLEVLDVSSLGPDKRSPTQRKIPQLRALYIEAVDEVLRRYPDFERTADVLFYTGAIYYVYGYEQEARRRLALVLRNYPDTQAAHAVASLFVNEKAAVEQWREVIALANLYARQNIGGHATQYERIELRARFKLAAQLIDQARTAKEAGRLSEAKEHFAEAADLYNQLLQIGAVGEYTDLALYNMAVALGEAGRSEQAIATYERVFREHPKSQYALPALFQVALWQEKRLDFDIASKSYLRLAKDYPKSTQAGDALLNAAVLREADGQFLGAASLFLQFATRFPDRQESPGAYLKAANLRAKAGDLSGQRGMLQKFISRYRSDATKQPDVVEAMVTLADSYEVSAQKTQSKKTRRDFQRKRMQAFKKAVALYKANPGAMAASARASYFAAQADFILMQPGFQAYQRMKIDSKRAKKQGKQLTEKGKKLAELEKIYKAFIATYKSAYWSAKTLHRIGGLYESLYRSMFNAPCPIEVRRIDPEFGCDEYFNALAEKAAPVEEKALQLYQTARQQAGSLSDPKAQQLLVQVQTTLHKMRPGEYVLPASTLRYPQIDDIYVSGIAAEGVVPSSGMLMYPKVGVMALFDRERLPPTPPKESSDEQTQKADEKAPKEEQDSQQQQGVTESGADEKEPADDVQDNAQQSGQESSTPDASAKQKPTEPQQQNEMEQ
ncbi:MAG: tetratricopeptide repeat protein [Myxococcota bacterium]